MNPEKTQARSHEFLRQHAIPINEALPLLETEDALEPQDPVSVARRASILSYVIGIGFDADVPKLRGYLEEVGLFSFASDEERRLLSAPTHTDQEKIDATWLTECAQSLAWCMGLTDLDPLRPCDDSLASHFPRPFTDPWGFISDASLQPFDAIYGQADLHYRLNWAARNARLTGSGSRLVEGIISERRRSLDWVIGVESDWDEIPLDT